MADVLDLLLKMEIPKPETKELRVKRLSKLCGEPVVFKIRQLSYNRVAEIKESTQSDTSIDILLAGTMEPDFKDGSLKEKYSVPTPAELVKKMLLPGEIEDLCREIEMLSGYRVNTLEGQTLEEQVKKK